MSLILQTADSLVGDGAPHRPQHSQKRSQHKLGIATANDTVDLMAATVTEVLSDSVAAVDTTSTVDAAAIAAVADGVADVNTCC